MLIAVVDDEAAVRKALKRLLSSSDLEAETFESGQAFIDSLSNHRPDCIVLDLHMPHLNGLDVLKQVSIRGLRLPVVVLTAHDEPGARAQCLAAGATSYFCKPLDDQTLLTAIDTALKAAPA
ncbi:MAG TPA: response regulator [Burkholderiales bacterium]|jgi:FixJ family two-component response regulator|nr:response regulator [Burkholderiales bacterium]